MFLMELWWPFCSVEQNCLCNFGRGHHKEHFFEIILKFDKWFRRCRLKILSLGLVAILFSRADCVCNFCRGHYEEHSCEILLSLDQMFRMRSNLKIFLLFSRMENIFVKLFKLDKWFRMRCNLKLFLIYSSQPLAALLFG